MHVRYLIIGMAVFAMLLFYTFLARAQVPTIGSGMGQAINSTASFINSVNQSGYLVFYPNLTQAYHDLNLAKAQSNSTNTSGTFFLLAQARQSAQAQLNAMNRYKTDYLYVLVASALALFALLYVLMSPRKNKNISKRIKRSRAS
jgi:hypothetical protein